MVHLLQRLILMFPPEVLLSGGKKKTHSFGLKQEIKFSCWFLSPTTWNKENQKNNACLSSLYISMPSDLELEHSNIEKTAILEMA